MMEILEEQYGDRFVGRWEKIKELKAKIRDNRIVVVKGNRGIGKTNLMRVVHKTLESEGKECHFIRGSFHERIGEIFKLPWFKRITSFSLPIGGVGWTQDEALSQSLKESKEKIIFVENAHGLDNGALERIFDTVCINDKLRFILEVPTPYVRDFNLKAGSYSVINVEELSHKETVKLVKNAYYNFSNDVVEKIATKSNGYPYVARVLVYICVNKKSNERMHEFLDILKDDEMHRLDQVHKEVLETLGEDAQGVITKLAIAPPILTYKLIEAFCGEEIDIRDIVERGILRTEKKLYWIYHPLFRDYLRETPRAMEKKKEIYCEAMGKIKSEFDSVRMLFEVLNEPDIFNELVEIAENYQALNSVAVQGYIWGKLIPAIKAWSRIQTKSQDEKNKEWEAVARGNMGNVHRIRGELDKALEYYDKALKINEELGRKEGMAAGYGNIGNVYQIRGELDKALEYYGKALKLHGELGRKEGMAADYGNMGCVYQIKGELDKALEYYEKALKLDEELGRKEGIASNYGNIGIVYKIRGELDKALEYYEKALRLDEEQRRKEGVAIQLGNIGIVYQIKGEIDKSLEYYEKALKLDDELGKKEGMAANYRNIASVYRNKGELDKALEYYGKALKLEEGLGKKEGMAADYGNMGIVYGIKGELDKALEYHGKALKLNEELGRKEGMALNYGNIGIVYGIKGELDKALEDYGKALLIFRTMGSRIQEARTLMNIGDVLVKRGEKERAIDFYLQAQELAADSSPLFNDIGRKVNELLGIKKSIF